MIKKTKRQQLGRVLNIALNVFNGISMIIIGFLLMRVFVFGSYHIPTDSMTPSIIPGDYDYPYQVSRAPFNESSKINIDTSTYCKN